MNVMKGVPPAKIQGDEWPELKDIFTRTPHFLEAIEKWEQHGNTPQEAYELFRPEDVMNGEANMNAMLRRRGSDFAVRRAEDYRHGEDRAQRKLALVRREDLE
jgi:hypothetical protein